MVTDKFVPMLVTVTLAFGMAAPDGSVTIPVNWPFWTWANAPSATSSIEMATRQNCSFFIDLPPHTCGMLFNVDMWKTVTVKQH